MFLAISIFVYIVLAGRRRVVISNVKHSVAGGEQQQRTPVVLARGRRRTEKLYERFMSAIIRSRVTQYRLIIEDEVQVGRQALTCALNSRRDSLGGFPALLSFYYFPVSPATRARTLILASLMRLCYFSPYP